MERIMWEGYPVHGDVSAIDAMLEAEGMMKFDKDKVIEVLASSGDNYVATGSGATLVEACDAAFESLPIKKEDIGKLLIDFRCGTIQPAVNELAMVSGSIAAAGPDTEVVWGITSDESLGDSYKVTLVASGH